MKKLFGLAALVIAFAQSSNAGSAVTYKNEALGFTLTIAAMSDNTIFMDEAGNELEFESVKSLPDRDVLRERSGKCEITMQFFSKDFAEKKTKDDFMLNLSATIVQVVKGECKLHQNLGDQKRSLTGIYQ